MYIDFDEYPSYSGRVSKRFETNVNNNIQCDHGYAYFSSKHKMCTWVNEESWKMMKECFPGEKQIEKCTKTIVCKECTYVQKDRKKLIMILIPHYIMDLPFQHHIFMKYIQ